jgi:glycerol-3-phosphate cytidylyltransferase
MPKIVNVLTYGTFDLFHYGHLNLLNRAKALGDILYVGVSNDEFNHSKNKKSYFEYAHRKCIVESIKCVDYVIEEFSWDQKIGDIKKFSIDIFAIGYDWKGEFDFLKEFCEVIYLPRSHGVSSSDIKTNLGNA